MQTQKSPHGNAGNLYEFNWGELKSSGRFDQEKKPPSRDEIESALNALDPNCDRETWVKIAMALKDGLGDAEGFALFDRWSQGGASYDSRACQDTWKSVRQGGGTTIKTLFGMARDVGWSWSQTNTITRSVQRATHATGLDHPGEKSSQEKAKKAAEKAERIWSSSSSIFAPNDNPYLMSKKIPTTKTMKEIALVDLVNMLGYSPKGKTGPLQGERILIIPILVNSKFSSLEFIDGEGRKSALAGGVKADGFWATQRLPNLPWCIVPIGEGENISVALIEHSILVGEGVATVMSGMSEVGDFGIAAMTNTNLLSVAKSMRERYPTSNIIVLADLVKTTGEPDPYAVEAAQAVDGLLAVPDFGPDRPEDATDFNDLLQIHGLEKVKECIEKAAPMKQKPLPVTSTIEPAFIPQSYRDRDWHQTEPEPRRWIIRDVLAHGRCGLLLGEGGSGKSWIIIHLAVAVTTGTDWLGFPVVEPGAVLILGGEDENEEAHRRIQSVIKNLPSLNQEKIWDNLFYESRVGINNLITAIDPRTKEICRTNLLDQFIASARMIPDLKLIVLDPLSRFRGGDENTAQDATRFVEATEYLALKTGASVLMVHHISKQSVFSKTANDQFAARGSVALVDGVRFVSNLTRLTKEDAQRFKTPEEERRNHSMLTNSKNNYARKFDDVLLNMVDSIHRVDVPHQEENQEKDNLHEKALDRVKMIIMEKGESGIRFSKREFVDTFSGIKNELAMSKFVLDMLIKGAIAKGELVSCQRNGRGGGTELFLPDELPQEESEHETGLPEEMKCPGTVPNCPGNCPGNCPELSRNCPANNCPELSR